MNRNVVIELPKNVGLPWHSAAILNKALQEKNIDLLFMRIIPLCSCNQLGWTQNKLKAENEGKPSTPFMRPRKPSEVYN